MVEETLSAKVIPGDDGLKYCLGGVIALIVGIFILGIPCGLMAVQLGAAGIKRRAIGFGTVIRMGGWTEAVVTGLGVLGMMLSNSGTP